MKMPLADLFRLGMAASPCLFAAAASAGPFAGPAGSASEPCVRHDAPEIVAWATGYKDYKPGRNVDPAWQTPGKALGPARDGDPAIYDIVSLGEGGSITMLFDHPICDLDGWDFCVFENSFSETFLELAYVEVSSDGAAFARFDCCSLTPAPVSQYGTVDPTNVAGFAGKYKAGLAMGFDLSTLASHPEVLGGKVDLAAIRFVRLVDVAGDGTMKDQRSEEWRRSYGPDGPVYDPTPCVGSAGFDLNAVGVRHAARPATLTMASSPEGMGATAPSGKVGVSTGTPVEIKAIPGLGVSFAGWTASPAENARIAAPKAAATRVVLSGDAVVTAVFDPRPTAFAISGRVSGRVSHGVELALSGDAAAATRTDAAGAYAFAQLRPGRYTITPSAAGAVFTPASRAVEVSDSDVGGQDFVSEAATCAVRVLAAPPDGGTTIPSGAARVPLNESVALSASPAGGHRFAGWEAVPAANVAFESDAAAATRAVFRGDAEVVARFEKSSPPLAVLFQTDGTPGAAIVGERIQYVASPGGDCSDVFASAPEGHRFIRWTGGRFSLENPLAVRDVRESMVITANFARVCAPGREFTIRAEELSGLPTPGLFTSRPRVYGQSYSLLAKSVPVKVLTAVRRGRPVPELDCQWSDKSRLFDMRGLRAAWRAGVGTREWLSGGHQWPAWHFEIRIEAEGAADQCAADVVLVPPRILSAERSGRTLSVEARHLWTEAPLAWIEAESPRDGSIRALPCRRLGAAGSPSADGRRTLLLELPRIPRSLRSTGCLAIGNGAGVAAIHLSELEE